MSGRAFDAVTLTPLAEVLVVQGSVSATTGPDGRFVLAGVSGGKPLALTKQGFAPQHLSVDIAADQTTEATGFLLPITATARFDVGQGGRALSATNAARADFPANSIVNAAGQAVTGEVDLAIASLDPLKPAELAAFPGRFEGTRSDGTVTDIDTFGPMSIVLSQAGAPLNLAPGQKAVVHFPITRDDAPPTIPLWSLDEATGLWKEEGTAYKTNDDQGRAIYRAEVTHLSYWNPDQPTQRSCVKVCVTAQGAPSAGTIVEVTGVGYGFRRTQVTGADGCVNAMSQKDRSANYVAYRANLASAVATEIATGPESACQKSLSLDLLAADPGNCPPGGSLCGATCRLLAQDAANCGACGTGCDPANACAGGVCQCPAGRTACQGACADLSTSLSNCGACGTACGPNEVCSAGACVVPTCGAGLTRCGRACINTNANLFQCGGCNSGSATAPCSGAPGEQQCQENGVNVCVNTQNNPRHCGACGSACAGTQECVSGVCTALNCGANEVACNNYCLSGERCGTACAAGEACTNGACVPLACTAPTTACQGTCVNTQTDDNNCGACNTRCSGGLSCIAGQCACPTGQQNCAPTGSPPSCSDPATDRNNCGSCGTVCGIGTTCVSGTCQSITCDGGTELCGNGCIVPATDVANCGGCTFVGPSSGGGVVRMCTSGVDCICPDWSSGSPVGQYACPDSRNPPNGRIECFNTAGDRFNCGGCGIQCTGNDVCDAGVCGAVQCPAGQTACNGKCVYGTSCGVACRPSEQCTAGACVCGGTTPAMCLGRCVDLNGDDSNCGACGTRCAAGERCQTGACVQVPCATGEYRCNGVCVNVNSNQGQCGGCVSFGTSTGGASCQPGNCSCQPPAADECPHPFATGFNTCVNAQTDRMNCGGCAALDAGVVCAMGSDCVAGACQPIICPTGLRLCGDGCVESPNCGVTCGRTETCVAGACQ